MNERELITFIAGLSPSGHNQDLLLAIGDDCAVVRKTREQVLLYSTDTLIEKVHFDLAWHPPYLLGRKAVSVNVSDVAAMGGQPRYLLFSLGLPKGFDEDWARELVRGVINACDEYGCTLVGGDTVASPAGITLGLTVVGEMLEQEVIYRSGAREGDMVLVSGPLGSAAAGLALCRQGYGNDERFARLCQAHLNPSARVNLGKMLAASGLVHAMMDLSDGLATDLGHVCRAGRLSAILFRDQLPAIPVLSDAAQLLDVDPVQWMIGGGEDYELLVTVAPSATKKLQEKVAGSGYVLYPVGRMIAGDKGTIRLAPSEGAGQASAIEVEFSGYDHFNEG